MMEVVGVQVAEVIKAKMKEIAETLKVFLESRGAEILEKYTSLDSENISAVFTRNRVFFVKYPDGSEAYWPRHIDVRVKHYERGAYQITVRSPLLAYEQLFIGYPEMIIEDFQRFIDWYLSATENLPSKVIETPEGINLTADTLITRILDGDIFTTIELKEITLKERILGWGFRTHVRTHQLVTTKILRIREDKAKLNVNLDGLWGQYNRVLNHVRDLVPRVIELQKTGVPIELSITASSGSAKAHITVEDIGFVTITPQGVRTGYIDFEAKEYKYYELPATHGKAALEHLLNLAEGWPLPLEDSVAIFNAWIMEEFKKIYKLITNRTHYFSELSDSGYLQEFDFKFKGKDVIIQLFLNAQNWPVLLVYAREDGRDYKELPISREIKPSDPLNAWEFVEVLFKGL